MFGEKRRNYSPPLFHKDTNHHALDAKSFNLLKVRLKTTESVCVGRNSYVHRHDTRTHLEIQPGWSIDTLKLQVELIQLADTLVDVLSSVYHFPGITQAQL